MSCTDCNTSITKAKVKIQVASLGECYNPCTTVMSACDFVQGSFFCIAVSINRDESTFEYYINSLVLAGDENFVTSINTYPDLLTLTDPLSNSYVMNHIGGGMYIHQSENGILINDTLVGDWTAIVNNINFTLASGDECCSSVTFTFPIEVDFIQPQLIALDDSVSTLCGNTVFIDVVGNDVVQGTLVPVITIEQPPTKGTAVVATENGVEGINYTANADAKGLDSFSYKIDNDNAESSTAVVTVNLDCDTCPEENVLANGSFSVVTNRADTGELYIKSLMYIPSLNAGDTISDAGLVEVYDAGNNYVGQLTPSGFVSPSESAMYAGSVAYTGGEYRLEIDGMALLLNDGSACPDYNFDTTYSQDLCDGIIYPAKSDWFSNGSITNSGVTSDQVILEFVVTQQENFLHYISLNPNDRTDLTAVTDGLNSVIVSKTELEAGNIWLQSVRSGQPTCYQFSPITTGDYADDTTTGDDGDPIVDTFQIDIVTTDNQTTTGEVKFQMLVTKPTGSTLASYNWILQPRKRSNGAVATKVMSGLGNIPDGETLEIIEVGSVSESFNIFGTYACFNLLKTTATGEIVDVTVTGYAVLIDGRESNRVTVTVPMQL